MKNFVFRILTDHHSSLSRSWKGISYGIPLLAIVPFFMGFRPTDAQVAAAMQAMSIYSALLFVILVPVGDQLRRLKMELADFGETNTTQKKLDKQRLWDHHKLAKELLANVAFSIVVSLLSVLTLFVSLCMMPRKDSNNVLGPEPSLYIPMLSASAYLFVFLLIVLFAIIRTVYGSWVSDTHTLT